MAALKRPRVCVLVQGELAQSPRMLNHARELAAAGVELDLVGFSSVPLPREFAAGHEFSVHRIARLGAARSRTLPRALFIAVAALRSLWLALRLAWILLRAVRRPVAILVQNPPALPAAVLAAVAARLRGTALIVDWHNLSAAMLAMRLGRSHFLVRAVERVERRLAAQAFANLCVSDALRRRVEPDARGRTCLVLHDRPRRQPVPLSAADRKRILQHLAAALGLEPGFADGRVLIATSTSWSEDEDMIMLLDGLAALGHARLRSSAQSPPLVLIATGLGPGRRAFETRATELATAGVRIVTGWLDDDLYRDLLRAAAVGISMHRSASGLDIPMKIVDMMEAGLPVLAYDYAPCLAELLPRERAAGLFRTAAELSERLFEFLQDYPDLARLAAIHAEMSALASPSWTEEWRRVMSPILAEIRPGSPAGRS